MEVNTYLINKRKNQFRNRMLKPIISSLEKHNYRIEVSYSDNPYRSPRPVFGFIPDIYAIKYIDGDIVEVIFEIQSKDNPKQLNYKKIRRLLTKKNFCFVTDNNSYHNLKIKLDSFHLKVPILRNAKELDVFLDEIDENFGL